MLGGCILYYWFSCCCHGRCRCRILPDVDVVVFFYVSAVVIVEVEVDAVVFADLAVAGIPDVTAIVSIDVAVPALEGWYAFSSIPLHFSIEVSTSTSLISLSFFLVVVSEDTEKFSWHLFRVSLFCFFSYL